MFVILALPFVGIAIEIGYWLERKRARAPEEELVKGKLPPLLAGLFVHPGHA